MLRRKVRKLPRVSFCNGFYPQQMGDLESLHTRTGKLSSWPSLMHILGLINMLFHPWLHHFTTRGRQAVPLRLPQLWVQSKEKL